MQAILGNALPCTDAGTTILQHRPKLLTQAASMVDYGAMKACSEDLRQKVVQAVEERGTSK